MKIAIILSRFPYPLEKGDKLRAYHFIRMLGKEHDITLYALSDRAVTEDDISSIAPFCKDIHIYYTSRLAISFGLVRAFFKSLPFQAGYFYNSKAKRAIRKNILENSPDIVMCQLVRVAEYVIGLPFKKVIDYQDALSMNMCRRSVASKGITGLLFRWEYRKLRNFERRVFDKFDKKIIISIPDKQAIEHELNEKIMVVPNGVDYNYFSPQPDRKKVYDIVFTGNMGYGPNVEGAKWLAKRIIPEVKKVLPDIKVLIAGASPALSVKALAGDNITITGWLPDIRDAYSTSKVFVAPMATGSGLQNKLLEAMAMRLPCITTPLANASLQAEHKKEALIADSTEEIANALITLLQNVDLADEIADNGYKMVRERYCWDSIIKEFDNNVLKKI